mmetsp:Transcript_21180/g.41208  ORF Transcript_21180/g.41208 Transcript_21180/m.41208 type:complete len:264 (-) Transcript_21180:16-807(-)
MVRGCALLSRLKGEMCFETHRNKIFFKCQCTSGPAVLAWLAWSFSSRWLGRSGAHAMVQQFLHFRGPLDSHQLLVALPDLVGISVALDSHRHLFFTQQMYDREGRSVGPILGIRLCLLTELVVWVKCCRLDDPLKPILGDPVVHLPSEFHIVKKVAEQPLCHDQGGCVFAVGHLGEPLVLLDNLLYQGLLRLCLADHDADPPALEYPVCPRAEPQPDDDILYPLEGRCTHKLLALELSGALPPLAWPWCRRHAAPHSRMQSHC